MFGIEFSKNIREKLNSFLASVTNSSVSMNLDDSDNRCAEVTEENGLLLTISNSIVVNQEYYVPGEVLAIILSYVNVEDLACKCRLVCHSWKEIVETFALKYKAERECASRLKKGILNEGKKTPILPWLLYYWILKKNIFGRNLLKNNCGQDGFKNWEILSNGGDKFAIEQTPNGADPLPDDEDFEGLKCCFATSYHSNTKIQRINLHSEGLTPQIMDEYRPVIIVNEWFAGRFDCGCVYELKVALLDKNKTPVDEYSVRQEIRQWEGHEWTKVQYVFKDYDEGVRYINFYHGGMDSNFWAGHYGCKMAGGSVRCFYSPPNNNNI